METPDAETRQVLQYARTRSPAEIFYQVENYRLMIELPAIALWQWLGFRLLALALLSAPIAAEVILHWLGRPLFTLHEDRYLFAVLAVLICVQVLRVIHLLWQGRRPSRIRADHEILHVETTTPRRRLSQFIPAKVITDVSFTYIGRKIPGYDVIKFNVEQFDGIIRSFPMRVPERVGAGRYLRAVEREVRRILGLPPRRTAQEPSH